MDMVDVLIHVHPNLSTMEREKLEEELRASVGIISVHFSPGHSHLLIVAYDPQVTSSTAILARAGTRGVEATKVGL
ncbi:MAG: hypothetical protein HY083_08825 [Gammaproteobacteria bacterium]|nr:hypothetical protein [Gammaproteobacteria bacterium]